MKDLKNVELGTLEIPTEFGPYWVFAADWHSWHEGSILKHHLESPLFREGEFAMREGAMKRFGEVLKQGLLDHPPVDKEKIIAERAKRR